MITKPAYNEEFRTFDFSAQLATGETLVTVAMVITDIATGTDVSATMISGTVSVYNSVSVLYKLIGGTAGKYYSRVFLVVTSSGQKLEATAEPLLIT